MSFFKPQPPTAAPETTPEPLVTPACSEGDYYLEDIQCDRVSGVALNIFLL